MNQDSAPDLHNNRHQGDQQTHEVQPQVHDAAPQVDEAPDDAVTTARHAAQPDQPTDETQAGVDSSPLEDTEAAIDQSTGDDVSSQPDVQNATAVLKTQIVRLSADLENMRRRHQQEMTKAHKFALEKCFRELMSVVDSLALALVNSTEEERQGQLYAGVDLTNQMLITALEKSGLHTIAPTPADSFNPDLHEAMTTAPTEDMPPNSVVELIQPGYRLHDRLLRPARVIVATKPVAAN